MLQKVDFYKQLDPLFPFWLSRSHSKIIAPAPYYRLVVLEKGPLIIFDKNEKRIVESKTILCLPPLETEIIKTSKEAKVCTFTFNQHFLDQLLLFCWKDKDLQNFISTSFMQNKSKSFSVYSISRIEEQITFLSNKIHQEESVKNKAYETAIMQYMLRILLILYREIEGTEIEKRQSAWQISDMINYIQNHYTEEFSLQDISGKYSFSPAYFSKLFKEKTGLALFEYINNIRIQKACILLKRTDQSIIDIAFAVGYNNISFFNRYFRKIMKMAPREYRLSRQR